jgi:alpha-N-arabinofuranosidase
MLMVNVAPQEAPPPPAAHTAVVYRRTSGDVTNVVVTRATRRAPRVDPRVFSNFLEHLGGSVYEALWANVIYNPQFGAEREARAAPARWELDGAQWVEGGLAGRAARLPEGAVLRQRVWLPVERQLRFRGSVWTRSVSSRLAIVEVSLRLRGEAEPLCTARVRAEGTSWEPRRFEFRLKEGQVARGEALTLSMRATSGEADVDMAELYPADAKDGCDPEVVALAKAIRIRLLRWPGGNFVSGYRWRDGVGPRHLRPTVPNPAWGGLETHHFGTDEFMALCRRIGAAPHICVNAGDGSPQEAAQWVEYCNGGADTPMGSLRAANGRPRPYNVRIWEIGNELYGEWQIGHTDAAGNARRYVEFRRAMLAADPTIEVIATGKGDQFAGSGVASDRAWNEAVLDEARRAGASPSYLSLHPLVPLPSGLAATHSYDDIYLSAMAHPQWWSQAFVPDLRRLLAEHGGAPAPRAAVTEWGIIVGGADWRAYANHDTQSGAVYAGLFFHAMLKSADVVAISNTTALMHGGCIRKHRGVVYVMPMIHVQRMYGQAQIERVASVAVEGPGYDVPQRGILPEVADVPWVDVIAAEGGGHTIVSLVNRDPSRARDVRIALPWSPSDACAEILEAGPRETNSVESVANVAPRPMPVTVKAQAISLSLPPCSVTLIRVK